MSRPYLAILAVFGQLAIGQAPAIQWQNRFGGSESNYSYSSQQTSDGGFIIGGRSNSNASFDKSQNTKGNMDYWLVKTDATGAKVWDRDYGAAGYDQDLGQDFFNGVIQCTDNGYLSWGWSNSPASGDKSEDAIDLSQDFWVVRSDSAGQIVWENTIGGSLYDAPSCGMQTADGGFLIGGGSESPISGDKDDSCRGGNDCWVVKLDANGNVIWQRTIGSTTGDGISEIIETESGFFLASSSGGGISADKSVPNFGSIDFWVIMISPSGTILWQKDYGGTGWDGLYTALKVDDGFVLAGGSDSPVSGNKTTPNKGLTDFWVIRIDNAGQIIWQKTYGGLGIDSLYGAAKCSDGGFVFTGSSDSPISGDKTEPTAGNSDAWIVRIDAEGQLLWQKTIGGNFTDGLNSITQTFDGGFFLSGVTDSPISGDVTVSPRGEIDYWIVKLAPENLATPSFANAAISIYPNPASSIVKINSPKRIVQAKVYDIIGALVLEQKGSDIKSIAVESLAEGNYVLRMENEGGEVSVVEVLVAR